MFDATQFGVRVEIGEVREVATSTPATLERLPHAVLRPQVRAHVVLARVRLLTQPTYELKNTQVGMLQYILNEFE